MGLFFLLGDSLSGETRVQEKQPMLHSEKMKIQFSDEKPLFLLQNQKLSGFQPMH